MWLLARGSVFRDCVSQVVQVVSSTADFFVLQSTHLVGHVILLSLRRLDLPCSSCKNRWGLALRETKPFFWCRFAASASLCGLPQRDVALVGLLLQLPRLVHCTAKFMIRVSFIGTEELS